MSDDAFWVTAGKVHDAFDAIYVGARQPSDAVFYLNVQEAGVYPFRVVYENGGGGAFIEWFTLLPADTRVLVNDTANGGVAAYRASTTSIPAYVKRVLPEPVPRQVNRTSPSLQIELSNLAKQLNILISDMGIPPDRILMDPTCAGVGYGMEYGYSVMERLRLAALQGDAMTQLPMIVTPGFEAWKAKESKVGTGVPEAWGDWEERAIHWETLTSITLLEAGADIVVLRHPDSVKRVKAAIEELMSAAQIA